MAREGESGSEAAASTASAPPSLQQMAGVGDGGRFLGRAGGEAARRRRMWLAAWGLSSPAPVTRSEGGGLLCEWFGQPHLLVCPATSGPQLRWLVRGSGLRA